MLPGGGQKRIARTGTTRHAGLLRHRLAEVLPIWASGAASSSASQDAAAVTSVLNSDQSSLRQIAGSDGCTTDH
jgi:hypothetical protein